MDKEAPAYLKGDPTRFSQILINLISNSVKFSNECDVIKVNIQLGQISGSSVSIICEVADTGIGMTNEQQQNLFKSFSQGDASTTRKYGGSGLGLTISKNLSLMMNGDIWFKSEAGVGTQFFVQLTFEKAEVPENLMGSNHSNDSQSSHLDEALAKLEGRRILLVDDNDLNLEFSKELLELNGLQVITAMNGQEALDRLEEHVFDMVLMDCMMPVMDGYEATKYIRTESNCKHVPVIAMTANVFKDDIEKVLSVGMNDHIAKPIVPETMFLTMAKWIEVNTHARGS